MSRILIAMVVAISFLSSVGCAVGNARIDSQPSTPKPRQQASGNTVQVKGTLTGEGVECQALRGDDGTLYTLSKRPGGFKVGDRVQVTGRVAGVNFCMQGTTINVLRMEKISE